MISKNRITFIRSLHQKKYREEHGMFIAEGPKLVEELLRSSFRITGIYGTKAWTEQFEQRNTGSVAELLTVTEQEMSRISALSTPGPVLAVVTIPQRDITSLNIGNQLTLVLDEIKDPGNLGTIIRVADWFGIRQVICSMECVDLYNPKVVQSTMGSLTRVGVFYTDLEPFLKENAARIPVYGTFLDGENLYFHPLSANGLIVIGNESRGIGSSLARWITHRITIPAAGEEASKDARAESLNAALATAVVCSEFNRRKYV